MTIEINLPQAYVTVIDDIDADLEDRAWGVCFGAGGQPYARWSNKRQHASLMMARAILARVIGRPLTDAEEADHRNHDTLDNRRENLRVASHAQNMMNRGISRTNKSGFKGVHVTPNGERYMAFIGHDRKMHYLGTYDTAEEAHDVYLRASAERFGEFAVAAELTVR